MVADDPTLVIRESSTPQGDRQGKTRAQEFSPTGAPVENFSLNDSLLLDKGEKNSGIILHEPFDVTHETEDLSYLEPATLAKKMLSRTQYSPVFCEQMLAFFLGKQKSREIKETFVWRRGGEVDERYKVVANPPPLFSEFGRTIGVSEKTLASWAKANKEFGEAYEICQDIIQEFFVANGLSGDYPGQFGIFAAKNLTKMKDVQVNKNENYDMKEILDRIEKGNNGPNQ